MHTCTTFEISYSLRVHHMNFFTTSVYGIRILFLLHVIRALSYVWILHFCPRPKPDLPILALFIIVICARSRVVPLYFILLQFRTFAPMVPFSTSLGGFQPIICHATAARRFNCGFCFPIKPPMIKTQCRLSNVGLLRGNLSSKGNKCDTLVPTFVNCCE